MKARKPGESVVKEKRNRDFPAGGLRVLQALATVHEWARGH